MGYPEELQQKINSLNSATDDLDAQKAKIQEKKKALAKERATLLQDYNAELHGLSAAEYVEAKERAVLEKMPLAEYLRRQGRKNLQGVSAR